MSTAWSAPGPATGPFVATGVTPIEVDRGSSVTVKFSGSPPATIDVRLTKTDSDKPCARTDPTFGGPLTQAVKDDQLTFLVPDTVPLGDYTVCAFLKKDEGEETPYKIPIPRDSNRLRVRNDKDVVKVKINSICQSVNYAEKAGPHPGWFHLVALTDSW